MDNIKVVGILNVTPDSFYSASRVPTPEVAVLHADKMIADGADIIDIGGESTRPGSKELSTEEELDRVLPVIQALRKASDIPLSIDTRKSCVATAAIQEGVTIVNDVSGLYFDPNMSTLIAEKKNVSVIIMHMRKTPQTMQDAPHYDDTVSEVRDELMQRVELALKAGISQDRIIIDPGIGFAKRQVDNLRILKHLSNFTNLGFPLYLGLSRKSFIGKSLAADESGPLPVEERLAGTLAMLAWAVLQGVTYVRVHDVRETTHVFRMLRAVQAVE